MVKRFSGLRLPLLAALMALLVASCDESNPLEVPGNTNPVITLDSNVSTFLEKLGATATINLRLSDNEGLKLFRVAVKHIDNQGVVVSENELLPDMAISGTNLDLPFSFPVSAADYQIYDKIRFTFYVLDNEGLWDSTFALINVIPDPVGPTIDYPLQSYDTTILFCSGRPTKNSPTQKGAYFNFSSRADSITNPADQDIADTSLAVFNTFAPVLRSPNNGSRDSIFVVTDASVFNYDACTYEIIWQAYKAAANPAKTTPPLKPGDIVIMKLKPGNLPDPMFAVMRILFMDKSASDPRKYKFAIQYKYSYKN